MPRYPNYVTQPLTGKLPSMVEMGPPDTRASSGPAPIHVRRLQRGRFLAGFGSTELVNTPVITAKPVPATDANDLLRMEREDDVVGNGIFDNAKRTISYPDAGIFQNTYALPGYIDRSKGFSKSEVRDITTDAPVVYVPGGAVSIDDNAKLAYLTGGAYAPLRRFLPPNYEIPSVAIDSVAVSPAAITAAAAATEAPNVQSIQTVQPVDTTASTTTASTTITRSVDPSLTTTTTTSSSNLKLGLLMAAAGFGVGWLLAKKKRTP
jgi:hypothetical protein